VPIPVDQVARAKFPAEDGQFVDSLAELNRVVNDGMTYTDDKSHYGVTDFWVMAPTDGKGDCEDYVLTKIFLLGEVGFPIARGIKIVTVLVHIGKEIDGHAILAVLMPHGSVAYLDMNDELMTRPELEAKGYVFFDWKA
jgi:predicted transglutaminase-like cysteine proteinase